MRKFLRFGQIIAIIVVVVGSAYILGVQAGDYLNQREIDNQNSQRKQFTRNLLNQMQTVDYGDTLLDISFNDINGQAYLLSEIVSVRTLFSYISPDCEVCQRQLKEMSMNITNPEDWQYFIIISDADPVYLSETRDYFNLGCRILNDENSEFSKGLNIHTSPFNFVLDRNLEIIEVYGGLMIPDDYQIIIDLNRQL